MDAAGELIEQIRDRGIDVWIAGPQPEQSIQTVENALGVGLPTDLRSFIAEFGGLEVNGSCVSGIVDDDPLAREGGNLYNDTMVFREDHRIPEDLLVIQPDEDAPYCISARADGAGSDSPVLCYELHSGNRHVIAPSFSVWLIRDYLKGWIAE